MAYATHSEYATYISPQTSANSTAEITRLLARASELLDAEVLNYCTYPVNDSGVPTVAADVATLRDAACAQVAWWEETGDDQGTASQYTSMKIGDVSLSRGSSSSSSSSSRVAPHAVTILRRARMLPASLTVTG